jgi:hypothetical protein
MSIKVLLVDDDPETIQTFMDFLPAELDAIGVTADWERAQDVPSARRALLRARDAGEPIDVVIVDLFITPGKRDQTGSIVLNESRIGNDQAYVLLFTGRQRWAPSFRDDYSSGTNHAITLDELGAVGRWSWAKVASDIRQHLMDTGRLAGGKIIYDHEDVGIVSVLEEVGHGLAKPGGHEAGARALRVLAFRCLRGLVSDESDIELKFLAAGRSGANVCRLDVSGAGGPNQSFVLKFGCDRQALEEELDRNKEAGRVLEQSSLMAIVGDLGSDDRRYYAITAKVASSAISLRRWLLDEATPENAATLAQMILLEDLGPFFRHDGRSEKSVGQWVTLRAGRKLRILAAMERYAGALGDARASGLPGVGELIQRLTDFVRFNGTGAGPVNSERKVSYVRAFGDLHSENILVQNSVSPRSVLIDASLYKQSHWSSDNARLLVDLLLRVRKPGVESMLWPQVPGHEEEMLWLCPYCQPESLDESGLDATESFITRAIRLLPSSTHREELSIPREVWHWEWHVALVRELLRQASYEDLTPPRACFALVAAGKHLMAANSVADEFGLA